MRISDWSSDVCSSDLGGFVGGAETAAFVAHQLHQRDLRVVGEEQMHVARQLVLEEGALLVDQQLGVAVVAHRDRHVHPWLAGHEVGAEPDAAVRLAVDALDRKSVVSGTSVSVRVDLGGRRIIKNKNSNRSN